MLHLNRLPQPEVAAQTIGVLNTWLTQELAATVDELDDVTILPFQHLRDRNLSKKEREELRRAGQEVDNFVRTTSYKATFNVHGLSVQIYAVPPTSTKRTYWSLMMEAEDVCGFQKLDAKNLGDRLSYGARNVLNYNLPGFDHIVRKAGKTNEGLGTVDQRHLQWLSHLEAKLYKQTSLKLDFLKNGEQSRVFMEAVFLALMPYSKTSVFLGFLEHTLDEIAEVHRHANILVDYRESGTIGTWHDPHFTVIRAVPHTPEYYKPEHQGFNVSCPWYMWTSFPNLASSKSVEAHLLIKGRAVTNRDICRLCTNELNCRAKQFDGGGYTAELLDKTLDALLG